jgi:hypothetical protein
MGYLVYRCITTVNKIIELQKILGRISAYGQFRKNDQLSAHGFSFFNPLYYSVGICLKVSYMVVQLGKGDFHGSKVLPFQMIALL